MSDTVAQMLRGLAQMDFSMVVLETIPPGSFPYSSDDPFVAAYPDMQRFKVPGKTTYRDEVVLLRQSIATAPTPRMSVHVPPADVRAAWELNEMPAVFRAVNPVDNPGDRGFPTYTYGRTTAGIEYTNAVRITGDFQLEVFPDSLVHDDPTAVVAMFNAAHFFARQIGFRTGFPTFNRVPIPGTSSQIGNEIVVFPADSPGVVLNSEVDADYVRPSWTFATPPVLSEGGDLGGFALSVTDGNQPLFFNVFAGKLYQYRYTPPHSMLEGVDPDEAGQTHVPGPIQSEVSAVSDDDTVHVLHAETVLIHSGRSQSEPDNFTSDELPHPPIDQVGYPPPPPGGLPPYRLGDYNHITKLPEWEGLPTTSSAVGNFHLFALYTGHPPDPNAGELLHFFFDDYWRYQYVDGDGDGVRGHILGNVGRGITTAWEVYWSGSLVSLVKNLHAFYVLTTPDGDSRLRHAELGPTGWVAETLDGSGSPDPPPAPGTGPTRASVGDTPTAASFDGSLWCIYEDRTYGNLRVARGTREFIDAGPIKWTFHVLDGSGRRGQTKGLVQWADAAVWMLGYYLSVFYVDSSRNVLRHARYDGTGWRYEVLDGDGGIDGRIDAPIVPPVAVVAVPQHDWQEPLLYVSYHWESSDTPRWSNVRLATLEAGGGAMP